MTTTLLLDGRPVRAWDYCRVREEHVMEEEIELRRRYGRGSRDGAADSADRGMDMGRMLGAARVDRVWRHRKEAMGMGTGKRITDAEVLLALSAASGPQTAKQIAETTGRSEFPIMRRLQDMADRGIVEKATEGGFGDGVRGRAPATWRLSDRPASPPQPEGDTAAERSKHATRTQVVLAVRELGRPTTADVAAHLGIGAETAGKLLHRAEDDGALVSHSGGTPGRRGRKATEWSVDDDSPVDLPPPDVDLRPSLRESVARVQAKLSDPPPDPPKTLSPEEGFLKAATELARYRAIELAYGNDPFRSDSTASARLHHRLDVAYLRLLAERLDAAAEKGVPF